MGLRDIRVVLGAVGCAGLVLCCLLYPIGLLLVSFGTLMEAGSVAFNDLQRKSVEEYRTSVAHWNSDASNRMTFFESSFAVGSYSGATRPLVSDRQAEDLPAHVARMAARVPYEPLKFTGRVRHPLADVSMPVFYWNPHLNATLMVHTRSPFRNSTFRVHVIPMREVQMAGRSLRRGQCHEYEGLWDSSTGQCRLFLRLVSLCVKVQNDNGLWYPDLEPNGAGCQPNTFLDGAFTPEVYVPGPPPTKGEKFTFTNMAVTVRSSHDPFLVLAREIREGGSLACPIPEHAVAVFSSMMKALGIVFFVGPLLLATCLLAVYCHEERRRGVHAYAPLAQEDPDEQPPPTAEIYGDTRLPGLLVEYYPRPSAVETHQGLTVGTLATETDDGTRRRASSSPPESTMEMGVLRI